MQLLESTLLTGPYDWDETVLPRSEYEQRLARVREAMAKAGASTLAIHGHPGNSGALLYVTGFTAKLGAAVAIVPREGKLHILAPGTPKMMDIAKLLTWVDDVRPLGNAAKTVAEFAGEGTLATWGFGTLPQALYSGIAKALAPRALLPLDRELEALRRRKSPREIALIRDAAGMVAKAAETFAARVRAGAGVRSAGLAAERAAVAAGAQDARVTASLSNGGTPLPLDADTDERVLDVANAGIAAQNHGYWASGTLTVARKANAAQGRAKDTLASALAGARAGTSLPAGVTANAIGLSLEEAPGNPLEAGAVYAVTSAAKDGHRTGYASALIAVSEGGCDVLWRSDPA
jgi:Xaa-Pro aminopeptidase